MVAAHPRVSTRRAADHGLTASYPAVLHRQVREIVAEVETDTSSR